MLSHKDFVTRSTGREWVRGFTDFYDAVGVVFGVTGTVVSLSSTSLRVPPSSGVAAFLGRSGDNLHLIGGGLIVVLFLLGALAKFAAMQLMQARLRRSPQAFERVVAAELFVLERRT